MSYNQKKISLNVQNLCKHFGLNRVFNAVSLTHTNGVLGIAGPNGSGKSTLLQCLAGLQRPSSGTVEWSKENQPIDPSSQKQQIGYAAPYINLYPKLSCIENLRFLMNLRNGTNSSKMIERTLGITGISELGTQLFGKLSTGQQQRLRLAAAIIHQPEILMLDEPGSNLDEKGRVLIKSLVTKFKEASKLVIIASNNPEELDLCDEVYSVEREVFL